MSFATSFGLSLKNLFTKKGRTALTSFAGSIGIIGIALIYAVSQGTTSYIDAIQEDTLSSYPLTLESQTMDLGSLMEEFISAAQSDSDHDLESRLSKSPWCTTWSTPSAPLKPLKTTCSPLKSTWKSRAAPTAEDASP